MQAPARSIPFADAMLARRIQQGDMESFALLVTKYQDRVYNTCWRICGNAEEARDVTQDAFLKALERIASFEGKSGLYTWLFRIAVNLALSRRRQAARRRFHSLDAQDGDGEAPILGLPDRTPNDPAARSDEAGLRERLADAMRELDEQYRTVVVLRDMEGLDYGEIAEILDIPRGTVKSRLARGREALRKALEPFVEPDG